MAKVLVLLAEGFEELEAVTVIDVLRRAQIEVVTAGLTDGAITSARQIRIVPDTTIDTVDDESFDMLILPGGMPGTENLAKDNRVREIVTKMYNKGKYTTAICAAPYVLSVAGVLAQKKATSYPSFQDKLNARSVITDEMVVIDGKVVTSQGPATALEFSYILVELLKDKETANNIANAMLYKRTNS